MSGGWPSCLENEDKHLYLIDGELFWEMAPGYRHGRLEIIIGRYLLDYAEANDLGEVTGEVGYYPADDRHTLLAPDVAFIRKNYSACGHIRQIRIPNA